MIVMDSMPLPCSWLTTYINIYCMVLHRHRMDQLFKLLLISTQFRCGAYVLPSIYIYIIHTNWYSKFRRHCSYVHSYVFMFWLNYFKRMGALYFGWWVKCNIIKSLSHFDPKTSFTFTVVSVLWNDASANWMKRLTNYIWFYSNFW